MACLEVMSSLSVVSAAIKMIQPFDLSDSVYGATVFASRDGHYITTGHVTLLEESRARTVVQPTSPMLKNLS